MLRRNGEDGRRRVTRFFLGRKNLGIIIFLFRW